MLLACLIFGIIMIVIAVIIAVIGALPIVLVIGRYAIIATIVIMIYKRANKRKDKDD